MPDEFDLEAYCARIGYAGPRAATLAVLRAVHERHPAAIPFENFDPLLRRPVPLDLPALQAKMIAGRRGGYCFEQNMLFAAVLDALGFRVTRLAGRVRWNAAPDAPDGPRTHMLLRVDLPDGAYLADVGFGGHLLDAPLRLASGAEQATPRGVMRLSERSGVWTLQAAMPEGWRDVYRFTEEPQLPADYVLANWFTSTNPRVLFLGNLLVQRLTPEGRTTLFNTRISHRSRDGAAEERVLAGPAELGAVLADAFGLIPPAPPEAVWERLPPP